jgi:hypothetical protein
MPVPFDQPASLKPRLAWIGLPQRRVLQDWRIVGLTISFAALIGILYSIAWLTFLVLIVTVLMLWWALAVIKAMAQMVAWLPVTVYGLVGERLNKRWATNWVGRGSRS